jgi:hypothetical protein
MSQPQSTFRRRLLLATILAGLHTALIVYILIADIGYQGEWSGFEWFLPYIIDYPASLLANIFASSRSSAPIFFFIVGILYWV